MVGLGAGSILYVIYIIFLYKRYSNFRKMNEAFFKFERSDLTLKMKKI